MMLSSKFKVSRHSGIPQAAGQSSKLVKRLVTFTQAERGFTLIELMVVISITAILGAVGIAGFVSFNQTQTLQTSANELVTTLNLARSRAASQVKLGSGCTQNLILEGYSVDIDILISERSYILKSHCSGSPSEIETKFLPKDLEFAQDQSIFFPVSTEGTQVSGGQITIQGYGKEKVITVNSLGVVSIQLPTPTP